MAVERMDAQSPALRLSILGVVVFSLFAALFARVWYLQVLTADEYQQVSQSNRVRVIQEEAPRGRILDRTGRVIVDNRTSLVVTIDRSALADLDGEGREDLLFRVASELTTFGLPTKVARLERRLDDPQYSPLQPIPVAIDVPEAFAVFLAERAEEFPGVAVRRESVRAYPHGSLAAHVVGYVGRISQEELAARSDDEAPKPYQPDSNIGKTGIERVYEADLRGTPGVTTVEVDAKGRIVRSIERRPPVPGSDVLLTLDIDIQATAEAALARQLEGLRGGRTRDGKARRAQAGAVVAIDPADGGVLAMASYPTYEPAEFVNGISQARYERLTGGDQSTNPLIDRAISGQYAPGSTWKPVTAYAAISKGMINAGTPYNDTGTYRIPACSGAACVKTNAGSQANGTVNLASSLTVSSDTYYYWIGDRFWRDREVYGDGIQEAARMFGFGERSGIDLPGESAGVVPDEAWVRELWEALPPEQQRLGSPTWQLGDNPNMAVGQGYVLATPLQVANLYATLANRGTLYQPRLAAAVLHPDATPGDPAGVVRTYEPVVIRQIPMPPSIIDPMEQGLVGVASSRRPLGTAYSVFQDWDFVAWPFASKTGTAEVQGKADSSLFAAYGPVGDPRYVVFALLEESGFGAEAAAPVVRRVLEPIAGQLPDDPEGRPVIPTGVVAD